MMIVALGSALWGLSQAAWADFSVVGLPQADAGAMAVQNGQVYALAGGGTRRSWPSENPPQPPRWTAAQADPSAYTSTGTQGHLESADFEQAVAVTPSNPPTPFAGYAPVPPPAAKSSQAPDLKGYIKAMTKVPTLVQKGSGYAVPCHGGGTMSMSKAFYQIMPEGWSMYAKPGLVMSVPVTYACKGRPWTEVMAAILKNNGYAGAVWWGYNVLTLKPHPASMPAVVGQSPIAVSAPVPASDANPAPDPVSMPSSPSPTQTTMPLDAGRTRTTPSTFSIAATPVFLLNKGDLILTDLQQWAEQSGWVVVWQIPEDWEVPNTTTFSGDFQKAVTQVIQALSANGANVHAVFHTANNTVVISGAGGGE